MDKAKFEEKFRFYLKRSRYSEAKLAEALGFSRSLINKWIIGQNQISIPDLYKLCDLFELSEDEATEFFRLAGQEDVLKTGDGNLSGEPIALAQLENPGLVDLQAEAVQVLGTIFAGYEKVVIKKEFSNGLSGGRVLEVRPIKAGGTPELPARNQSGGNQLNRERVAGLPRSHSPSLAQHCRDYGPAGAAARNWLGGLTLYFAGR